MLLRLAPRLALPGDRTDYFPHEVADTWGVNHYSGVADSPLTPYYRLGTQAFGDVWYGGKRLGVVLGAPLYPPTEATMMDPAVVSSYREDLRKQSCPAHRSRSGFGG